MGEYRAHSIILKVGEDSDCGLNIAKVTSRLSGFSTLISLIK